MIIHSQILAGCHSRHTSKDQNHVFKTQEQDFEIKVRRRYDLAFQVNVVMLWNSQQRILHVVILKSH